MRVEVVPAEPDREPVVANLFELYAHDFSELFEVKIGEDGRFGYGPLPLYWRDPDRFPFLIRVNGELAGFVLIRRGPHVREAEHGWDVAEFFVLRGYRRQGVGMRAAHEIWSRLAGHWQVRVREGNTAALDFWMRAVGELTGKRVEPEPADIAGQRWHVILLWLRNAEVTRMSSGRPPPRHLLRGRLKKAFRYGRGGEISLPPT